MQFQQIAGKLNDFVRGKKRSARKRSSRRAARLGFENLESRLLMSRQAILDFNGAFVSEQLLDHTGWNLGPDPYEGGHRHTPAFHDLFANQRDADNAIRQITEIVRQHFSPYDLQIRVADSDPYHFLVRDNDPGDVVVIVTGGEKFPYEPNVMDAGNSGHVDEGNLHDSIVYVYGGGVANYLSVGTEAFVEKTAKFISHEMGHAFGLHHPNGTRQNPALESHIMGTGDIHETHPNVFLDVDHLTVGKETPTAREGTLWQNSHQILTEVLGPATRFWAAVLKPGELTLHGDNNDNRIEVTRESNDTWSVDMQSTWRSQYTAGGYGKSFVVTNPQKVFLTPGVPRPDHPYTSVEFGQLNPFREPINTIEIYGEDGNDVILVETEIYADVYAWGGNGSDRIWGGSGNDQLRGEAGVDQLHGRGGHDTIWGGNNTDYIYGGRGDDYLYGGAGADRIWGGYGRDRLWGGWRNGCDKVVDYLYGQGNQDWFFEDLSGPRDHMDKQPYERVLLNSFPVTPC
jgi:hypothetical protein